MDEISLYNRALSSNEIAAIYNAGNAGKCLPSGPPVINSQAANQTLFVGDTANFSVSVSGALPLSYQWSVNGTNIVGATSASLTLINVQVGQAGNYSVAITNALGATNSASALLTVNGIAPSISSQSGNQTVAVDQTVTFNVVASGSAPLSYQWSVNGTNIVNGTNATLTLTNVQTNQTGNYSVAIANAFGSTNSANALLTVYGIAPTITSQPTNQTVTVSQATSFSVTAGGTLPLFYQWSVNGTNILNGTNATLTLINVQTNQAGNYSVAIVNAFGSTNSANALLTVNGIAPSITSQPNNQTVAVGQAAGFSVTAAGTVPLSYQWSVNGTNINNATNAILTLTNVQTSQAGNYSVAIANAFGSTNSISALLTVISSCVSPPAGLVDWWQGEGNANDIIGINNGAIQGGLSFTNGEVGQAFLFNTSTAAVKIAASPSLNVGTGGGFTIEGWIKPSGLSSGQSYPIAEWNTGSGTYGTHFHANVTYGGNLYANIVDTGGTGHLIYTTSAVVTNNAFQHVALTYDKASGVARLYRNGAMVLQQTLGSFTPQTSYNLYLGQRPGSMEFVGAIDELSLYNRALSSSEVQAIYAAGSYGKCVPQVPPFVVTQPANQTVTVGQTATFSVTAGGTAPLFYQWSVNGTNIAGAIAATLTLTNVQTSQAGNYSVAIASALGGTNSANAVLTVNFPPAPIQVVSTNALAGTTVDVPINLVANGNENALSFSLNFDTSRLTYSDIALGSGAQDAFLLPNLGSAGSGVIGVTLALPSGETFAAGTQQVVVVAFNAPILTGTQTVVTAVSFTNQPIPELLSDVQGQPLPNSFSNGTVALSPSPLEGDVSPVPNGDGYVNIFDWVQVGRFVVGLDAITNGSEFQRADCAPRSTLGDGQLDVTDWVQAGRYAAGLDPLTLAGGPTGPVNPSAAAGGSGFKSNGSLSRQVSIANGTAVKGLPIILPVTLQAQGNETALGFSLNFDPTVVQYSTAAKGSDASSTTFLVNTNQAASGKLGIVLMLPIGSQFSAGTKEVAKVTFVPVAPTTNYSVAFADLPATRSISDTNAGLLAATYVSDSIVINPNPPVNMSVSGNSLNFQWPVWASGFVLQSADSLTPPVTWTTVPVMLQTNGVTVQASVSQPTPPIYYRLYHP